MDVHDRDEILFCWLEETGDTAARSLHICCPQGAAYYMAEIKRGDECVEYCFGESPRIAVEGLAEAMWRRDRPDAA